MPLGLRITILETDAGKAALRSPTQDDPLADAFIGLAGAPFDPGGLVVAIEYTVGPVPRAIDAARW